MLNLLVVDDEKVAVKGITTGIDWSDMFSNVFEAFDATEARKILKDNKIDVLIADIEMPDENGLELLEWVCEHSPQTETIFLTGHTNFNYAQQAVRLGGFDYLLKPVDHNLLKQTVGRAVEKIKSITQNADLYKIYQKYYDQWISQLPVLTERFWQELLNGRIPLSEERLQSVFLMYDMPLSHESFVLPVLISIEQWNEELADREEIMEYAIRETASEILLKEVEGCALEKEGSTIVIIYLKAESQYNQHNIRHDCEMLIQACNLQFGCSLSCYVGEICRVGGLIQCIGKLFSMECGNLNRTNCVLIETDAGTDVQTQVIDLSSIDWVILLETCCKEEIIHKIGETIKQMKTANVDVEAMDAFYHRVLSAVYLVLHKKGLTLREIFPSQEVKEITVAIRNINQLQNWANKVMAVCCDYISNQKKTTSSVITKICQYIDEHYSEDIQRGQIAGNVHLNSAYLSRLFKKEMGLSIWDYLVKIRMENAKKLLVMSNIKVSAVAEKTGYTHFSFFAKKFKEYSGLSPQEFRKQFQAVGE